MLQKTGSIVNAAHILIAFPTADNALYNEMASHSVEEASVKAYDADSSVPVPAAPLTVNTIPHAGIEDSDSVRPYEVPVCRSVSMLHTTNSSGMPGRRGTPDNSYDEAPKRHSIPSIRKSRNGSSRPTAMRSSSDVKRAARREVRSDTLYTITYQDLVAASIESMAFEILCMIIAFVCVMLPHSLE